jgi:hypothetical protein
MEKNISPCNCGCTEFVTKPNQYEIYEILDGKLVLTHSEATDEETRLFCRGCAKELKNAKILISE